MLDSTSALHFNMQLSLKQVPVKIPPTQCGTVTQEETVQTGTTLKCLTQISYLLHNTKFFQPQQIYSDYYWASKVKEIQQH